ncbi:anti-sigma-L factor RslA [mine drainage metagenome]|uniref:Anti-sigma-L factor RslA n=1 Tax=mine drainage metagenome TaxID=410659 RepID=A0A1J5R4A1_9ZZZZ
MTTRPDPFEHDDAAYVLGLLSDEEDAAFVAHLATCVECTERVRQLAGLPAAPAGLTERDLDEPVASPVPAPLLPGLLRRAAVAGRRRRWMVGALTGVAAAGLVALVLVVSPLTHAPHAGAEPVAMTAVTATPLTATATLQDVPWGTRIELNCRYTVSSSWSSDATYRLQAVDRNGVVHDLGTWTAHAGAEVTFTSGTDLPRADLAAVQITLPDGTPVLRLTS